MATTDNTPTTGRDDTPPTNPDRKCRKCGATSGIRLLPSNPLTLDPREWECLDNCDGGARMTEQVFTFGHGQTCPYTGKNLIDHHATVIAGDSEQCRALMIGMFGQAWSFQYDSLEKATRGGQFPSTEHMRIVLGGAW